MVWAGRERNMTAGVWGHLACLVIGTGLRGEWSPGVVCVPRLARRDGIVPLHQSDRLVALPSDSGNVTEYALGAVLPIETD